MSGFIAIWERGEPSGSGFDPASDEVVRAMLAALPAGRRQPSRIHRQEGLCLGTLADLDSPHGDPCFPLAVDPVSGVAIVMDGRLDDAGSFATGPDGPGTQDARLLLAGYIRWGEAVFERWIGPLSAVVFDPTRGCLVAARDALGDRCLCYSDTEGRLIVASAEAALLVHPLVDDRIDRDSLERFYALEGPRREHTFFESIRELPPAHAARFETRGPSLWRHWTPPSEVDSARRSDEEWATDFLGVLDAAVRARLPRAGAVSLMLSGGIDSSTVAGLAARALPDPAGSIRPYSYVFDAIGRCDERTAIDATCRFLSIEPRLLVSDQALPYSDLEAWPDDAAQPMRPVQDRLTLEVLRAVEHDGGRVLLAGTFGDHLFSGAGDWLADLLRDGRIVEAARELARHAREAGLAATLSSASVRRLFGRLRDGLLPTLATRPALDPWSNEPVWLVGDVAARRSAAGDSAGGSGAYDGPRPGQRAAILGDDVAWTVARGAHAAAGFGVDLRLPYRDRRLVELALRLPAHQLYNRGQPKHVLRSAARGLVPDSTARPGTKPSLGPLFDAGRRQADRSVIRALLFRDGALWRGIVDEPWLDRAVEQRLGPTAAGVESVTDLASDWVVWRCVAAERWSDSLKTRKPAPNASAIGLADSTSLRYAGRTVESGPPTLDRLTWRFCT